MDSPRGRIYLMKSLLEKKIELTDAVRGHFDKCLGCMACVTACPSGVKYDKLIEGYRAEIERQKPRPPADRFFRAMLFSLFPYPARLRAMLFFQLLYVKTPLLCLFHTLGVFN